MTQIRAVILSAACLLSPVAGGGGASAAPGEGNPAQEAASNLLRGNTAQAIVLYTEALKDSRLTNDRRGAILNDRAVAYARTGQSRLAIDDFNRAIQLFPEHAASYNNRGNLLLALGLAKEAIRDFDRAILLAPGYAAAFANRAGAHDRLGHADDAVRDYTRAIELMPQSPVPLAGRGRVLLTLGRPHSAIRDFTRAANADARFANAYRGRASAKLRIHRYEDAIEDFSRAIAFDSASAELYVLRGGAYLGVRNFAAAVRDFTRALEIEPKSALAFAGRGLGQGYLEAFDDAFADLNRAIEAEPKNPVSFAFRAVVYSEIGQTDVGTKDIETAMKLDPNRAEVLWARGVIAEAQGRAADAVPDYRRAAGLAPEFTLAAEALRRAGGDLQDSTDVPVPGSAVAGWSIVQRGSEYYAVSAEVPGVRVPLESPGVGQPRLIDWDVRKPPFRGIGVLRFEGGVVQSKKGSEPIELTAIVDIPARTVVAVEPHKLGSRTATWTWDDGKIVVASVDGVTDEFVVRASSGGPRPGAAPGTPGFDYAEDPMGRPIDPAKGPPKPVTAAAKPRSNQKPKTIFDLLFGN